MLPNEAVLRWPRFGFGRAAKYTHTQVRMQQIAKTVMKHVTTWNNAILLTETKVFTWVHFMHNIRHHAKAKMLPFTQTCGTRKAHLKHRTASFVVYKIFTE